MRIFELMSAFILGGSSYVMIELLYRGHSHISMAIAGGISFLILHMLFSRYPEMSMLVKCAVGLVVISSIELLFGVIVNIYLKLGVWDYSNQKFNLWGQICLRYSLYWAVLTVPIAYISKLLHAMFA